MLMKCPKCGENCEETDRFCRNCGAKLSEAVQSRTYAEERVKSLPPEVLANGKLYKYALKAVFIAFAVSALLFFLLPVDGFTRVSVYRCAAASDYGEGIDSRWDDVAIIIQLVINIFSNIDLVITPCAVMVLGTCFGALFAVVWAIVFVVLEAKQCGSATNLKAEIVLFIFYALFAMADAVLMFGLKAYGVHIGNAPIALMVLTAVCFALTIILYVKRSKFFKKHGEVAYVLKIK